MISNPRYTYTMAHEDDEADEYGEPSSQKSSKWNKLVTRITEIGVIE